MSSASDRPTLKQEPPKEKDFRNPGLRGMRTTTLFRAINPELFIKPIPLKIEHQTSVPRSCLSCQLAKHGGLTISRLWKGKRLKRICRIIL
ncbi:small integral membrane protein 8 isoform X4 [Cavia porcellus]